MDLLLLGPRKLGDVWHILKLGGWDSTNHRLPQLVQIFESWFFSTATGLRGRLPNNYPGTGHRGGDILCHLVDGKWEGTPRWKPWAWGIYPPDVTIFHRENMGIETSGWRGWLSWRGNGIRILQPWRHHKSMIIGFANVQFITNYKLEVNGHQMPPN